MGKNNHTTARADAKASGALFYETGLPCVHGHVAPRWTTSGRCTVCQDAAQRSPEGKARDRAKHLRNPDAAKARAKRWRQRNPVKARASAVATSHNSRAAALNLSGRLTADDVLRVVAAGSCLVCQAEDRLTVDHIVCMTKGGENAPGNLQCLCLNCNSQKHTMPMDEFMARRAA